MKITDTFLASFGTFFRNKSIASYTSWKVGGVADVIIFPETIEKLKKLLQFITNENIAYKVIGRGSNLLVSDERFQGIIICLTKLEPQFIQVTENRFSLGAGASMQKISRMLAKKGYTNHEFMSGIPGTIGGAVYMNAGTNVGEIKDVLIQADVLLFNGTIQKMSNVELEFTYRSSILKKKSLGIVLAVDAFFPRDEKGDSLKKITEMQMKREQAQPLNYPSCGSVFKNPEGLYAGELIESLGLKGYTLGGAQVSEVHANFIVNKDKAQAADIKKLIELVKEKIWNAYRIELQTEVEYFNW